jgi:hypothetical protein
MTNAHPDDETLSAVLDGEGGQDADAHVAGCASCRERLTELRAAAAALADAPVPPPAVRESAIRAALIESAAGRPGTVGPARPARRHRYAHRQPLVTVGWVAAAAAVIALLVAVPALLGSGGSSMKASSTASATTAVPVPASPVHGAQAGTAGPNASASSGYAVGGTVGGRDELVAPPDLGAQSDPVALGHQLDTILQARSGTKDLAPATTPGAEAVAGAPPTTAPSLRCAGVAANLIGAGPDAALTYGARLTWRGTPAEVYVFATGQHRYAGVMNASSCQLLRPLAV